MFGCALLSHMALGFGALAYTRLSPDELERREWTVDSPMAPVKLEEDEIDPKSDPPGMFGR